MACTTPAERFRPAERRLERPARHPGDAAVQPADAAPQAGSVAPQLRSAAPQPGSAASPRPAVREQATSRPAAPLPTREEPDSATWLLRFVALGLVGLLLFGLIGLSLGLAP